MSTAEKTKETPEKTPNPKTDKDKEEPAKSPPVKEEEKKEKEKVTPKGKPDYLEKNDELTPIQEPEKGSEEEEESTEVEEKEEPTKEEKKTSDLDGVLEDLKKQAGDFAKSLEDLPVERQLKILYGYIKDKGVSKTPPKGNNPIGNPVLPPKPKTLVELNESTRFLARLAEKTGFGQSIKELLGEEHNASSG